MSAFPQTIEFMFLNQPIGEEYSLKNLKVEGALPAELRGAHFRAVPDPAFPPKFDDDTALSGDGMISRTLFNDDGTVDFDIRYVETARHKAEAGAGMALFGRYRNPFTDDPAVKGVDRTVANTTPVWHAGRLLMTKEDGRAYRIDPHTLETLGSYDFEGVLKSETMTAHVRIDPETGEMFFYGYEADGLASKTVAYCIADRDGRLIREQWFDAPYCSLMHDFVITKNYAIFPVFPTTSDLARLKDGGDHWVHHQDVDSWVGIMPRYGDVKEMHWIRGRKGVSVFHFINAFEDDTGRIHLDQHLSETNAFGFIRRASGIDIPQWQVKGATVRWSFDPKGDAIEETVIGPPGDLCRLRDADQGRPYRKAWYLSINPEMQGPPVMGGPVGVMFNMLIEIDPETRAIDALALPPGHSLSEPAHIVSSEPGHAGWLLFIVDRQIGETDFAHEMWVVKAGDITKGPVAKIAIPHRLRPQVHGWWVTKAQLDAAV